MVRPKRGEPGHEAAVKKWHKAMARVAKENGMSVSECLAEYGRKGGIAHAKNAGFGSDKKGKDGLSGKERAAKMGATMGKLTKRGRTYLYEKNGVRFYRNKITGAIEEYGVGGH